MRLSSAVFALLVLISTCRAVCSPATSQANRRLHPRGSSRSPSPEHHHELSGLLGDIVAQGTKKTSLPSLHSSTTHPAHPSQSTQGHPAPSVDASQPRPKRARPPKQPKPPHPDQSWRSEGLRRLGASLDPSGKQSIRRPPGLPKETKPDKNVAWWKQAGGLPIRSKGTGPRLEENRRYKEKLKQRKMIGKSPDVSKHPSGHQSPKGGGPGSPGAGSHAVGKRRLPASDQEHLVPLNENVPRLKLSV